MENSMQLISDLDKLANTDFSPASQSKARSHPERPKSLVLMAGTALLQAARLKTLLLEIEAVTDHDDPQFALLQSILGSLN